MSDEKHRLTEEIVRRQLTPVVVPILEKLQQAETHAGVLLKKFSEQSRRETEHLACTADLTDRIAVAVQRVEILQRGLHEFHLRSEKMFRVPAEPSCWWWGIVIGIGIGFCAARALFILLKCTP